MRSPYRFFLPITGERGDEEDGSRADENKSDGRLAALTIGKSCCRLLAWDAQSSACVHVPMSSVFKGICNRRHDRARVAGPDQRGRAGSDKEAKLG